MADKAKTCFFRRMANTLTAPIRKAANHPLFRKAAKATTSREGKIVVGILVGGKVFCSGAVFCGIYYGSPTLFAIGNIGFFAVTIKLYPAYLGVALFISRRLSKTAERPVAEPRGQTQEVKP